MTNAILPKTLQRYVIGRIPTTNKILIQGASFGVIAFALFEFFSTIDQNIPRIPVLWLLIAIFPIVLTLFFFKIIAILRNPRHEDIIFILGLDYQQRTTLALSSFVTAQSMLKMLMISSMIVAIFLELSLLHIHSPFELLIPPVVLIFLMYLLPAIGMVALKSGFTKPVRKDDNASVGGVASRFGAPFARMVLATGLFMGKLSPKSIRAIVLRNTFLLVRSEPLMLPIVFITVPMLLTVMILIINDVQSPFIDLFSVVAFFAMCTWQAQIVRESSAEFQVNHDYPFNRKQILFAFAYLAVFFSLSVVITYCVAIGTSLIALRGVLRLLTGLLVMISAALVAGVPVYDPFRKESDQSTGAMLFGGACIGLFVPYAGLVFPVLVLIAFTLKEWKSVHSRGVVDVE